VDQADKPGRNPPKICVIEKPSIAPCRLMLYSFLRISERNRGKPLARNGKLIKAVSYLRTSSATNVGEGKDSDKRQRSVIAAFAKRARYEIVDEFYDPAVRGEDEIEQRPGFAALLDRIESNGVRVVIIEDVTRFARKLLTQELGIIALAQRGVIVLTATGDDLTNTEDEMKVFIRQVAGAFAQLEKARLVRKLRGARDRKRAEGAKKVEGRKSWAEINPELVQAAKRLRGAGRRPAMSLRKIAVELTKLQFKDKDGEMKPGVNERGKPFSASSVASMIAS
jgi:DNA invertase Pin-like site-specific DNA recombinase